MNNRGLPDCAPRLWAFNFLNAICFTIAMGSPLVLTARFLGAGEALVGFLLALTPLFTILQLPAARYADRWGYRAVMMAGWRARAVALLLMAPLPVLLDQLPRRFVLVAFTVLALTFNAIRGFASGSWLPWLKQLIPASQRGRYFSMESLAMNCAILGTLWASGWFLGKSPPAWHYSVLLAVSGLVGMVSVLPLRDVPAPPPGAGRASMGDVIRRTWALPGFRRIVRFAAFNNAALAATPGFVVLYIKEVNGLGAGTVVAITSVATIGAMAATLPLSRHLDRIGSRPVLVAAALGYLGIYLFWSVHALFHLPPWLPLLLPFFFCSGVINNSATLAAGRLVLNECPLEEATTAMALSQVLQSLGMGVFTVAWGFILEALRSATAFGQASRLPFLIYFACTMGFMFIALLLLRRIEEPR